MERRPPDGRQPSVGCLCIPARRAAETLGARGQGAAGTFPKQVHVAVGEQHVQQLQGALHVPRAHPDHLRDEAETVRQGAPPALGRICPLLGGPAHPTSPRCAGSCSLLSPWDLL